MERSEVLENLIKSISESSDSIIHLSDEVSVKELSLFLEAEGFFIAELDRAPIFNKETLLHALYQSCRFPAYFGFNWDALEDSLGNFSWIIANAYVLVFNNFDLLKERESQTAERFLSIIDDVAASRHEAGKKPLKMIIRKQNRV